MLRHQFGHHFIFRLNLLLQMGDSFLFRLIVGVSLLLESRRSALEELLPPAVEHGRLQPKFVAQIRDGNCFHQMLSQNGDLFFRRVVLPLLNALALLQFGVFGFGGDEDGDVRVGVFPERQEIVVGSERARTGGVGIRTM
jgi:hypothetical protein